MAETAIAKPAEQLETFLSRVGSAQTSLIQAINANDPLRASFAEAEAKMILLEGISPEVAAYLLRFCDPKIAMVEVVNTGDKDRIVNAVAHGILNGFVPGKAQFGVHTGKMYVKEDGYRKLFSNLNGCGAPDVQVGHPELADLGNGRKVWKVDGVASVVWRGEEFSVECVKDFAIGIPSNNTDQIDGIKTKARRRILQLLWKKVSSVGIDDSEDEFEQPSVHVVETPKQITQAVAVEPAAEPELTERERQLKGWRQTYKGVKNRVKDKDQFAKIHEAWMSIMDSKDPVFLQACEETLHAMVKDVGQNNVDELNRLRKWCLEGLEGQS